MSKELNNWKKVLHTAVGGVVLLAGIVLNKSINSKDDKSSEEVIFETKNHKFTRKN